MPLSGVAERLPLERYDALLVARKTADVNGFHIDAETRQVTGRQHFDICLPYHMLAMGVGGSALRLCGRFDNWRTEDVTLGHEEVLFLPAHRRFRGYTEGAGSRQRLFLFLDPETIARTIGADMEPARLHLTPAVDTHSPVLAESLVALAREVERPGRLDALLAEGLAITAVVELAYRQAVLPFTAGQRGFALPRLRRVLDYIGDHIADDLSLVRLAAQAELSPVQLGREFRQRLGVSVHQYILRRRVERARALLLLAGRSLSDIAFAAGFSSQAHLTTAFRRAYRVTPGAFREDSRLPA
jgi:AraC family transcriptional regulator